MAEYYRRKFPQVENAERYRHSDRRIPSLTEYADGYRGLQGINEDGSVNNYAPSPIAETRAKIRAKIYDDLENPKLQFTANKPVTDVTTPTDAELQSIEDEREKYISKLESIENSLKKQSKANWNNINHSQMLKELGDVDSVGKLQQSLGVKADGVFGQQSAKALQRKLKAIGLYDGPIDGKLGKKSIAGLRQMLQQEQQMRATNPTSRTDLSAGVDFSRRGASEEPDTSTIDESAYGGENDYYDDSQGGYYGPKDREYARGGRLSRKYGKPYKRSKDAEYYI